MLRAILLITLIALEPRAHGASTRPARRAPSATSCGELFSAPIIARPDGADSRALWDWLITDTGFPGIREYRKAIGAIRNPRVRDLAERLKKERLEVVIFNPLQFRASVFKKGMRNFHQTLHTSTNADKIGYERITPAFRAAAEASMMGISEKAYRAIPKERRPKHGLIAGDLRELGEMAGFRNIRQYGSDAYVLDLDKARPYLTLTPGDSLNRLQNGATLRGSHDAAFQSLRAGKAVQVDAWDLHYIPWEMRDLLIPFLYRTSAKDSPFVPLGDGYDCPPGLLGNYKSIDPRNRSLLDAFHVTQAEPRSQYVEAQFWAPDPGLEFMKAFVFFKAPPTQAHYERMKSLGIKVYDGRKYPPQEFAPRKKDDFSYPTDILTDDDSAVEWD